MAHLLHSRKASCAGVKRFVLPSSYTEHALLCPPLLYELRQIASGHVLHTDVQERRVVLCDRRVERILASNARTHYKCLGIDQRLSSLRYRQRSQDGALSIDELSGRDIV